MGSDTARKAIDFLAEAGNGECTVTFFGGEPLMELDLLKETVSYAEAQYGRRIQFRMSTNGTLLDPSALAFLKDHDIHFVLSLDGDEQQHDANRQFSSGRGSFGSIIRRLPDVLKANPYTIAVSVVSPNTAGRIASGVCDLFGRGFRYVLQTLDYAAPWRDEHIKALRSQYLELSEFYAAALRAGEKIYYSPFDERIKTWAQKPYQTGDLCDLANSQIAIAASGRIYPCVQFIGEDGPEDQGNAIGDVANGFVRSRRQYFIEENYAEKESCRGCALEGRCATFCGCVNWRATGDLKRIPPIICEHERMLMPIVDSLANNLWKKNVELFRRKFYDRRYPVASYIEDCLWRGKSGNDEDQTDSAL
jgi:uncharacterized protein